MKLETRKAVGISDYVKLERLQIEVLMCIIQNSHDCIWCVAIAFI